MYVDRKDFVCIDCNRVVDIDEQRHENYHQTKRCKNCFKIFKRERVRLAVQKHREKNK